MKTRASLYLWLLIASSISACTSENDVSGVCTDQNKINEYLSLSDERLYVEGVHGVGYCYIDQNSTTTPNGFDNPRGPYWLIAGSVAISDGPNKAKIIRDLRGALKECKCGL